MIMNRFKAFAVKNAAELWLAAAASLAFAVSVAVIPFLFEVPKDNAFWLHHAKYGDVNRPLEPYEHYLQLNSDVGLWIRDVADFPANFAIDNRRIDRPVYPAAGNLVARLATAARTGSLKTAFTKPCGLGISFAAALFVNYLIAVSAVLMLFRWLRRRFSSEISFVSALLFALSPFLLWNSNQVATNSVAYWFMPAGLFIFESLLAEPEPSWGKILRASLLLGTLMLVKTQYDIMFIVWCWAASRRNWRVAAGTFALHFIPLLLWMAFLPFMGLHYSSVSLSVAHQGYWPFEVLAASGPAALYKSLLHYSALAVEEFAAAYSPLLLGLFLWGITREQLSSEVKLFAALGVFFPLAQIVMVRRFDPFYAYDTFFIVYPVALTAFCAFTAKYLVPLMTRVNPKTVLRRGLFAFAALEAVIAGYFGLDWTLYKPQLREAPRLIACAVRGDTCVSKASAEGYAAKLSSR